MTPNVLVTGGAGFIGSHLCEKLVLENYETFSLDNYSSGSIRNHVSGVTYISGDTQQISDILPVVPDVIFHLGEYSRVEQSFNDVSDVMKTNMIGTLSVLEYCRMNQSKLVYAGSSTKFADGGMNKNQSPYAWTKATNSDLVINYGHWFNMDYNVSYFYNVYGPRENTTGNFATVIGIFKHLYQQNMPLTVVKPGTQRRNFTHVADIVEGLFSVGLYGKKHEYNIGSTDSYSVLEIADMFNTRIKFLPERAGNRMNSEIDIHDIQNEFGWSPKTNIEDYVRNIVETHDIKRVYNKDLQMEKERT